MHLIDYAIIVGYLVVQFYLGISKPIKSDSSASELILGGRMLTLPAFVASLVSTWYGGILGIGEYTYRYGISNWFVLCLPYYIAAFLFAYFLATRVRQSEHVSIPDRLQVAYGTKTALAGSTIVFMMACPTAYIVMVGTLFQLLFGWSLWQGILFGTLFSTVYVYTGGFNALVRNDIFQFSLMFGGFILLFCFLFFSHGGFGFIQQNVPATHLTWHGGRSGWFIATWYVIALATLIDPAFFQRCYAAKSPQIARRGILVSIACWALFDFLTTSVGLYARALLPHLDNPVGSFPALATQILPAGLAGIFAVAMLVTVMSSVDSYSFLAAATLSRDIVGRVITINEKRITFWTRIGLGASTVIALTVGLFIPSAVDVWYAFGSIGTPALLVPVLSSFAGRRRLSPRWALFSISACGSLSLIWYLSTHWTADAGYWFGLEPIFPGLALSLLLFGLFSRVRAEVLP